MSIAAHPFTGVNAIKKGFFDGKMSANTYDLNQLHKNRYPIEKERNILKESLDKLHANQDTYTSHQKLLAHYDSIQKTYDSKRGTPATKTLLHAGIDTVHDNLGMLHFYRILYTFARLTDEQLLRLFNQMHGPFVNFDASLHLLQLPVDAFNALSVILLSIRFTIEMSRIAKHTLLPTVDEADETTWRERFMHEISKEKYGYNLMNDMVWATLNALSNYPDFFNIPVPIANGLVTICLVFDFSVLIYKYRTEQKEYTALKESYLEDIANLQAALEKPGKNAKEIRELRERLLVTETQLKILKTKHLKTIDELQLQLLAAGILFGGFILLLAAGLPFSGPVGAGICLIGMALYTTCSAYTTYQEKTRELNALLADGSKATAAEIEVAKAAQAAAMRNGLFTLTKNVTLPALFMATLTICWPAAIALLAVHIAYEMRPKAASAPEAIAPEEACTGTPAFSPA